MPITRLVVSLVSAGTVLACSGESTDKHALAPDLRLSETPVNEAGPSASGHVTVIQASGTRRTFSFTARRMPDGTVHGQYENHNRALGFSNHGDVDCLRFVGENIAVMSGTIRRSDNPAGPEGGRTIFRVEDYGEGADSPPDRVSMLALFPPGGTEDCANFTPTTSIAIIGGNIRVDADPLP